MMAGALVNLLLVFWLAAVCCLGTAEPIDDLHDALIAINDPALAELKG